MNTLLKGFCLVVYALAVVGIFIPLPGNTATIQYAALILLGGHVLEIFIAFKSVRLYKGPLAVSVLLTVLFGFLHWIPLAKEEANAFK
ncbi:hypothetical protein [Azoarcus sp. KH32C]|uniref:hypothetical protein n=1 Tax=Azoarcus sp. KH32C TaxID=748247 RepID=UPI0002385CB9|nr:hypothetical protein [Azoarcus sp. KH32C]BAL27464.1 hypothetical protein AZKH_p0581 [Azoarcus sp. KH32C]